MTYPAHWAHTERALPFLSTRAFCKPANCYMVSAVFSLLQTCSSSWGACAFPSCCCPRGRFHIWSPSSCFRRRQCFPSVSRNNSFLFCVIGKLSAVIFFPLCTKAAERAPGRELQCYGLVTKFWDRSFVPFFNYTGLVPATLVLSRTSFSTQPLGNQCVCRGGNTVCQVREPLLPVPGHSFLSAVAQVMFSPVMKSWLH